ncbi:segregation and condensation protein A [Rhodobium gokarnense]|uniref:Segregation and condensation protein A n=1 Tax=Rhodobium gokarnense TaxID=364296 RepID=A0ABT3HFN7_9HYPH|nr:ScpA family protein [Rhodobium gokarnense]MCW2309204.1 segregation and condensation protein A [Rhodobium gokarnense]
MGVGGDEDAAWGAEPERSVVDPTLLVDVDGFEGPLGLLLELARTQKVDLTKISILALSEQYLRFIEEARRLRLEIAADYLVMAAWLAYLKSKLLLPVSDDDEEPSAEELAAALAFRLRRLEAMREAAARLMNRDRLGRDVFARGMPEALEAVRRTEYEADLYDLLSAYAIQRQRTCVRRVAVRQRDVWSLEEARQVLSRLVGMADDWTSLQEYLIAYLARPEERATAIASTFSASLEMVREGKVELRQADAFAPLYVRRRATPRQGDETPEKGKP